MKLAFTTRITNPDAELINTLRMANLACQFIIDEGMQTHTFNKTRLHHATYAPLRATFPTLNSSLITAIRDQASDMLKRLKLKQRPTKRSTSGIRLNHNTFKPFFDTGTVSISTTSGRRTYTFSVPAYVTQRYTFTTATAATLRQKHGRTYLDIQIIVTEPKLRKPKNILGIDRGLINPAVTSDSHFFNGKQLRKVKGRYAYLRSALQRAGTRSAKRHLMKLRGRERRFVADTNHCISKAIVNSTCDAIAVEELNPAAMKMRQRRGRHSKRTSNLGSWSPTQLLRFIEYKARILGKCCIHVASHFTSQACNRCGHIDKRNRQRRLFLCTSCGYSVHADLNAARNIACLGKSVASRLRVNQPIVKCNEFKSSPRDELRKSIIASSAFLTRT